MDFYSASSFDDDLAASRHSNGGSTANTVLVEEYEHMMRGLLAAQRSMHRKEIRIARALSALRETLSRMPVGTQSVSVIFTDSEVREQLMKVQHLLDEDQPSSADEDSGSEQDEARCRRELHLVNEVNRLTREASQMREAHLLHLRNVETQTDPLEASFLASLLDEIRSTRIWKAICGAFSVLKVFFRRSGRYREPGEKFGDADDYDDGATTDVATLADSLHRDDTADQQEQEEEDEDCDDCEQRCNCSERSKAKRTSAVRLRRFVLQVDL